MPRAHASRPGNCSTRRRISRTRPLLRQLGIAGALRLQNHIHRGSPDAGIRGRTGVVADIGFATDCFLSSSAVWIRGQNVVFVWWLPLQHNRGSRARLNLCLAPPQRTSNRPRRIALTVQYQIRMPIALQPLPDSAIVFGQAIANEVLGRMPICVRRGRRDLRLPLQALPQVAIAAPNVLL